MRHKLLEKISITNNNTGKKQYSHILLDPSFPGVNEIAVAAFAKIANRTS